jgi:hypothetical protein
VVRSRRKRLVRDKPPSQVGNDLRSPRRYISALLTQGMFLDHGRGLLDDIVFLWLHD